MTIRGIGCNLFFYGFLIFNIGFVSTKDNADDLKERRNEKSFSLSSVVTFKNEECTSESTWTGGVIKGTCYTSTECSDKSGTTSGNCASGFGVCCLFISNTGTATISENRTYLQSLLFPAIETSTAAITYTVNKFQEDICQIRLDFDNFAIAGPVSTSESGAVAASYTSCGDMMITTLSSGAIVPVLCGTMTGSHIYLDVGMNTADLATIALTFATAPTAATAFRSWRIKTSQIPCWAPYRAPAGCHQYMTGSAYGQIWSPNFRTGPTTTTGATAANYATDLMGLDLKYCIRREAGMCCTLYQVCNYDPDNVTLDEIIAGGAAAQGTAGTISPGFSFMIDCRAGVGGGAVITPDQDVGKVDEDCTGDYVEIDDSTTGIKNYGAAVQINSRYCCNRFGNVPGVVAAGELSHAPIWDCTEPFEVLYHTDIYSDELVAPAAVQDALTIMPRGLCLLYKQEAC